MGSLKRIELAEAGAVGRVIHRIDREWMLLTAGTAERLNTMTASWGSVGVLWNRYMVNIFVRPERYTYGFIEEQDYFSAAFFGPRHHEALALCGAKSGRDIDKVAACNFTVAAGGEGGVYFQEADLVLICKKRYRTELDTAQMIDMDPGLYYGPHGGVHTMYMGEIVEVYAS